MILTNPAVGMLAFALSICLTPTFLFGVAMFNLFLLSVLGGIASRG
jgi:hypothetical protein